MKSRHNTSVKAIGNGKIGGYLVVFGDAGTRDLQGEYFTAKTEFNLDWYEVRPALYHHGLDGSIEAAPIGKIDTIKQDSIGLWAEAQIDMNREYGEAVQKLVDKGVLHWSSGSLAHLVETKSDGQIKKWPIVEGSLTPTPAEPRKTDIQSIKSAYQELGLSTDKLNIQTANTRKDASNSHKGAKADEDNTIDNSEDEEMKMNEEVMAILQAIQSQLAELAGGMGASDPEKMAEEVVEEIKADDEIEADDMEDEEEVAKSLSEKAFAILTAKIESQQKASNAAKSTLDAKAKAWARNQKADTSNLGGFSANDPNKEGAKKSTQISVGEMRKFANLTGSDMALGVKMLVSGLPHTQRNRVILGDLVSDGYARTMAQKLAAEFEDNPLKDPVANYNIKSVLPFKSMKADEFNASDITAQGIEWVTTAYDEQLWERVRDETTLFDLLQSKGMRVVDIPQGAQSVQVQTDTASGSVFYRAEANDLASNVPEVTAVSTAYGTGNVTLTAKEHVLAYFVTDVLQEDSILDSLKFANQDMITTLAEALEDALINGDTTSDTTNINHDGAALTAAPQRELWRVWEGIRHNFLIDNTSLRADHATAALAAATFLSTRNLLPGRFRNRRQNLLFLMDYATEAKARQIAELFTRDVAYGDATLFTGVLPPIDGVEVYTSGFLRSADTDGKVTDAGNTTETGTLACIYAPYWAYARKRQVSVEAVRGDRSVLAGGTQLVATVRHDFSARGANASSGTFNIQS